MTRTIDPRTAAPAPESAPAPSRGGRRPGAGGPRTVRGRRVAPATTHRSSPGEYAQRVPFVVVVLGLIGTGVGGTLWLSAQSTEETYALKDARDANVHLVERKESLLASNERARSAEVLAERAQKLGMVGVDSAPILVRGADGRIEIVGEPEAKLGAPIEPLQPAPVPSGTSKPPVGGFDTPSAQAPQDATPRGIAPVPYPPFVAAPPAAAAPQPAPPNAGQAPVQAPPAGPATLAPVPGLAH